MRFSHIMDGWVELELTSARFQSTLRNLNEAGIELYGLQQKDFLTGSFWVKRRDCGSVIALCEKQDGKIRIIRKLGLYWVVSRLKKRPVLILGMALLLTLILFLPSRILFVNVEGNRQIPDRMILSAADECGISFGASRRAVRSEKVKNALLSAVPELQWAGVNTSGCVATISVRERTSQAKVQSAGGVGSIVAQRDGYVLSASATKGTLMVQPGQTVQKGQLLISGYTDCGLTIRAEQAEGEVYAQTQRQIQVITPATELKRLKTGEEKKKISLLLGKKRINLWKDSGISIPTCGRMYAEYYITLPGGFQLPAAICIERYPEQETIEVPVDETLVHKSLSDFARRYLSQQMSAGELLREESDISCQQDTFCYEGSFVCREMIGRVRKEQIGESNGENSGTNR